MHKLYTFWEDLAFESMDSNNFRNFFSWFGGFFSYNGIQSSTKDLVLERCNYVFRKFAQQEGFIEYFAFILQKLSTAQIRLVLDRFRNNIVYFAVHEQAYRALLEFVRYCGPNDIQIIKNECASSLETDHRLMEDLLKKESGLQVISALSQTGTVCNKITNYCNFICFALLGISRYGINLNQKVFDAQAIFTFLASCTTTGSSTV